MPENVRSRAEIARMKGLGEMDAEELNETTMDINKRTLRRTKAKYQDVMDNIKTCEYKDKQIGSEIKYALDYYKGLAPAIYVSCMRTSYVGKDNHNLRITFDEDLKYRMNNLSLQESIDDKELTDKVIMEIKVLNSYPLWLTSILAGLNLFPRGFSKVGTAFIKEKEND